MTFPSAIQAGKLWLWLGSIGILIVIGALWPGIMKTVLTQAKTSETEKIPETVLPAETAGVTENAVAEESKESEVIAAISNAAESVDTVETAESTTSAEDVANTKITVAAAVEEIAGIAETTEIEIITETTDLEETEKVIDFAEKSVPAKIEESLQVIEFTETTESFAGPEIVERPELAGNYLINKLNFSSEKSDIEDKGIDQLLDLGFAEKISGDFSQATAYFLRALALEPEPEIAFYLIIDCHWLWKNNLKSEEGLKPILFYAGQYAEKFSPDLQRQFEDWLRKEDIMR